MGFDDFKENAYLIWSAAFSDMIQAGMDAKDASESARNLVQQVLTAYGCMESDRLAAERRTNESDGD